LLSAQTNQYYIGLDIGPKFDQYRIENTGAKAYTPNLNITNPMAATFGVLGGVKIEDKIMVEAGIYKSDYRVNIELVAKDGSKHFSNTPINTFTSYMVPFNVNFIKSKQGKYEPQHFIFGTGFSLLARPKLGLTGRFASVASPLDPLDLTKGLVSYEIYDNDFDADLVLLNVNAAYQYPINEDVNIHIGINGKIGVAGKNFFKIDQKTPNNPTITNTVSSTGSSIQISIGFRYFIPQEDVTY
jgi:hypothetical protein